MPTTYAGNPANDPDEITLPSDGDGPGIKASDVGPGFEGLADRTASLRARIVTLEGRRDLVEYQKVHTSSTIYDFTDPITSQVVSSIHVASVATLAGDIIEVTFDGAGILNQAGSGGTATQTIVVLRASENGASSTDITGSPKVWSYPFSASSLIQFGISTTGIREITTPGTLTIDAYVAFNASNTGDRLRINNLTSTLKIWRQS